MSTELRPFAGQVPENTPISWQRKDQGQDAVLPWGQIVYAPGNGVAWANGSDRGWPDGFGPSFARIFYHDGPFAGHAMYNGHGTSLVHGGQPIFVGTPVSRQDQGHPSSIGIHLATPPGDGGWIEFGETFADGSCGPFNSSGHWFDAALRRSLGVNVLRFGDTGLRVMGVSRVLVQMGYMGAGHYKWTFDQEMHQAVKRFRIKHGLCPVKDQPGIDHGVVDDATDVLMRLVRDQCKKTGRRDWP